MSNVLSQDRQRRAESILAANAAYLFVDGSGALSSLNIGGITDLRFPRILSIGQAISLGSLGLTNLEFPLMQAIANEGGALDISGNVGIVLSIPRFTSLGGTFNLSGCGFTTNPLIGLATIVGGAGPGIDLSGNALPDTVINTILAALAAIWPSGGGTLNLSGGTNGIPWQLPTSITGSGGSGYNDGTAVSIGGANVGTCITDGSNGFAGVNLNGGLVPSTGGAMTVEGSDNTATFSLSTTTNPNVTTLQAAGVSVTTN